MLNEKEKLEEMQKYAYDHNIDILSSYYDSPNKGYCAVSGSCAVVMMNLQTIQSPAEYLCVLAEEIGHIMTDSILLANDCRDPAKQSSLKRINELKAISFAIKKLVSTSSIQAAIDNGCYSTRNIAASCGVTEDFMVKALAYYEGRQIGFLGGGGVESMFLKWQQFLLRVDDFETANQKLALCAIWRQ